MPAYGQCIPSLSLWSESGLWTLEYLEQLGHFKVAGPPSHDAPCAQPARPPCLLGSSGHTAVKEILNIFDSTLNICSTTNQAWFVCATRSTRPVCRFSGIITQSRVYSNLLFLVSLWIQKNVLSCTVKLIEFDCQWICLATFQLLLDLLRQLFKIWSQCPMTCIMNVALTLKSTVSLKRFSSPSRCVTKPE